MAMRSTGAFVAPKIQQFAIVLKLEDHGTQEQHGGYEEMVISESSRRIALGKAFAGRVGEIAFCKTAEEMTYDERGYYGMQTVSDQVFEAQETARRRAEFMHCADMY